LRPDQAGEPDDDLAPVFVRDWPAEVVGDCGEISLDRGPDDPVDRFGETLGEFVLGHGVCTSARAEDAQRVTRAGKVSKVRRFSFFGPGEKKKWSG